MNDALVKHALALIDQNPTDPSLRAVLASRGHQLSDIDQHLEHLVEEGIAGISKSQSGQLLWRLKLRGKELLRDTERAPIGF
ncbi:MAG: hypothetical protein AAGF99_08740 [Bacteroidota bacterium]